MAETENAQQKQSAPEPYVPPSRRDVEELSKALAEEGLVESPVTPEPAKVDAPKEPKPPEPPPAKVEEELPAITKIAKKQAEFRKEVEQYKPVLDLLTKARNKQITPADALAALGYTHSEYVDSILGKQPASEEPEAPKASPAPSRDPEIEELRKFKAQYEAEKAQQARQQALQGIAGVVQKGGDKFKHLAALEKWDAVEQVIINHHAQTGTLPGDTFEESVALAAEVVEAQLKQESQKWAKLYGGLTSGSAPASVPAQKAPESTPSTGAATARTLTNSNTTAPAAVRPVPKTRAEVLAALIEGREDDLA